MQVARRRALLIDVPQHPGRLVRRPSQLRGDGRRIAAEVVREQDQIQCGGRKGEIELFLRLRQRVGVGGRRPGPNRRRDVQEFRECVHLRFVQVGDGLHVRQPVSAFDEEPLVVLEPVGRADDGVVKPVGVEVLQHRPDALLEVGRRDDLAVFGGGQPHVAHLTVRKLDR